MTFENSIHCLVDIDGPITEEVFINLINTFQRGQVNPTFLSFHFNETDEFFLLSRSYMNNMFIKFFIKLEQFLKLFQIAIMST